MSWASSFVRFGSLIFVLPLVLTAYTDLEQSLWFLTSTIISFAMLADSGFGSVLVRAVAYFNAGSKTIPKTKEEYEQREELGTNNPNLPKLIDLLTTSNRIYLVLGLLVIVLLSTLGLAFIWNIMELSGHRNDFWIAYFLLIPYCYLSILIVKWSSFTRGLGFVALEARVNLILSTVRVILFIVLLLMKMKPAVLIGIMLFELVYKLLYLRWFIHKWFVKRNVIVKNRYYFDKGIFLSIWPATWKLAGIFWGNYLVDSGNSIIIAQISDAKLMSSFLFTTRIVSFLKTISQTPFYANVPSIYKLAAQKKLVDLKERSSEYIFTGITLFAFTCAGIIFFGNWILGLLDTDTRFLELPLFFIMCVTVLLDLHASFHATIYTSTNHIPFFIPSLISGSIIIALGFYVLPIYGLIGILLVRLLTQIAFNNWYAVFLSLRLLDWSFIHYLCDVPQKGLIYLFNKSKEFGLRIHK
jgi:O-antigen/teichoic acid export membrane protein